MSNFIIYRSLPYVLQAIALFNANEHDEAVLRVQELAAACPDADTLACYIVEVSIMHDQV
jgi:hypothetical protein